MDHAAAERLDPLQRRGDVGDREVGQRERVAGAAPTRVHTDGGSTGVRLPALALAVTARPQLDAEQALPEAPCALRIVGRELDTRPTGAAASSRLGARIESAAPVTRSPTSRP